LECKDNYNIVILNGQKYLSRKPEAGSWKTEVGNNYYIAGFYSNFGLRTPDFRLIY